MRRYSRVSSISPNMVKRAIEKGVEKSRVLLFPNWVDTRHIYPLERESLLREQFKIDSDKIVALYSGNMGEKQGLDIIVEAARELRDDPRILFVMCGTGAAHERLRSLGKGLNNILWIPLQPLERLNELLNLADIHLLPQSSDVSDLVMPSKLTGILASGKPVIATALPGTQLAKVVNGLGTVTAPGDTEQFRQAIENMAMTRTKGVALAGLPANMRSLILMLM